MDGARYLTNRFSMHWLNGESSFERTSLVVIAARLVNSWRIQRDCGSTFFLVGSWHPSLLNKKDVPFQKYAIDGDEEARANWWM